MNQSKIFTRTSLGHELLGVPYGKISGDARRVLALIDGRCSVGDILAKVPLSVQVQMEAIFEELLSAQLIAVKVRGDGDIVSNSSWFYPKEEIQQILPAEPRPGPGLSIANDGWKESRRSIELEQELAEVRAQLEETKRKQKEIEDICRQQEQQLADSGQGKQDTLEDLSLLNDELKGQREILDNTLRLRMFQMQLSENKIQPEVETESDKEAYSHPHYKKLRGLEFFKNFANAELLHFLNCAKWQQAEAGDTILHEGEEGMLFYILVSGSVKVIRNGHLMASLGWGEFFGEFAHLSGGQPFRSAHVEATTDCEMLAVDPLEVEFSSVQMRLHVVEALLRGQVRRALLSSQRIDNLLGQLNILGKYDPL